MTDFFVNNLWALWLVAAFLLLILELTSGDFVFTCFAIGAVGGSLACALSNSIWLQLIAFILFSVVSLVFIRPPLTKWLHGRQKERNSNADALIGRLGKVIETIPAGDYGYVQVDGDHWKAQSADGTAIEKGTKARIVARESIIVTVETV